MHPESVHQAPALRTEAEPACEGRARAPKDRPIPFSGPMVRALLAGTKTQTRRVLKVEPPPGAERVIRPFRDERLQWAATDPHDMEQGQLVLGDAPRCPYGAPGDRLWVRETWQAFERGYDVYRCIPKRRPENCGLLYAADDVDTMEFWRPSIHMPRWASRITLEITGVRVERLQDISEEDAEAEGVDEWARGACGDPDALWPSDKFELLWCGINGRDSWQANPWVWVLSLRKAASVN